MRQLGERGTAGRRRCGRAARAARPWLVPVVVGVVALAWVATCSRDGGGPSEDSARVEGRREDGARLDDAREGRAHIVAPTTRRLLDLFTAEGGPIALGEVPRGLSSTAPSECAGCHAEIAAEWAGSAHAQSWTDPIFQAEYRLTRSAFCRNCHAPLAGAESSPELAGRGIDCAVCHVRDGRVLGTHGRGGADHAARRDARLATTAFCGSCHQFDFPAKSPGEPVRFHPGQPVQNTVVEWSQSRFADRPCQACHMPRGGSGTAHASHAFRVLDDPALMARAVRVTAKARRHGAAIRATIEIAPDQIGHAFPTGDMFRRAVLTVRAGSARRREVLMRTFAMTITGDGRGHLLGQVDDTRVPPDASRAPRFELVLEDPRATEVTWSLDLFRLAPDDARARGIGVDAIRSHVQSGSVAVQAQRARERTDRHD